MDWFFGVVVAFLLAAVGWLIWHAEPEPGRACVKWETVTVMMPMGKGWFPQQSVVCIKREGEP